MIFACQPGSQCALPPTSAAVVLTSEYARHIAAGNKSDQVQPIASDTAMQLVTVQSQHAQSSADREAAICRRMVNRVLQVISPASITLDVVTSSA